MSSQVTQDINVLSNQLNRTLDVCERLNDELLEVSARALRAERLALGAAVYGLLAFVVNLFLALIWLLS